MLPRVQAIRRWQTDTQRTPSMSNSVLSENAKQAHPKMVRTFYRTAKVKGLNLFYREAGPENAPAVVLLHGFPSSSHMFRDLIPILATRYHEIAPDYPGFGHSDAPKAEEYENTNEQHAEIVNRLLEQMGIRNYSVYIQD